MFLDFLKYPSKVIDRTGAIPLLPTAFFTDVLKMVIVKDNNLTWKSFNFILGAYVVGGECTGIEAKVSKNIPITMNFVDGKPRGYRTAVFSTSS